jgi:GAF domain-containing protein
MSSWGTPRGTATGTGVCGADGLHALSAAIDRLGRHASSWSPGRLADEGLDLVRDAAWADASALVRVAGDRAVPLHRRPDGSRPGTGAPCAEVPLWWFPWGLAPVRPDRYLLVEAAGALPVRPGGGPTLGELGYRSCLHLPLHERGGILGALQVFWREPRLNWDDGRGRLLRTLGRFLLAHHPAGAGDP